MPHRNIAVLAAIAALSVGSFSAMRKARHRLAGKPHAKPPALQTWEGEGGGLPEGGPGASVPAPRRAAPKSNT